MEKILSVDDVAGILQVKPITVREMFREKRLRAFKVGKSWRTTQTMLQEDIAALARGEAPEVLPPATAFAPSSRLPRVPGMPAAEAAPAAPKASTPAPPPAPVAEAPVITAPVAAPESSDEEAAPALKTRSPRAAKPKPADPEADVEQQLLF
jgi:excisionase family DNA binding protein